MRVKFQADADFNHDIIRGIKRREPAIDFQTGHEAGLDGLKDPEVLALAAGEGRVLVSHDRRTLPKHFSDFVANRTSAGVILVSQDFPLGQAIDELIIVWEASTAEEWVNCICVLPL